MDDSKQQEKWVEKYDNNNILNFIMNRQNLLETYWEYKNKLHSQKGINSRLAIEKMKLSKELSDIKEGLQRNRYETNY